MRFGGKRGRTQTIRDRTELDHVRHVAYIGDERLGQEVSMFGPEHRTESDQRTAWVSGPQAPFNPSFDG